MNKSTSPLLIMAVIFALGTLFLVASLGRDLRSGAIQVQCR